MITEISGVKIHWIREGQDSTLPPVLLLHGWGCSVKHFDRITEELGRDRTVYAIDFPAHGESGNPPEPWGVPEFAELTKAFIEQNGIAPCDIIAHSFGGRVTLWLASHWPQLVNRLVLTGCAGLKKQPTEDEKKRSSEYRKKKKLLETLGRLPLAGRLAQNALEKLRFKYGSEDYRALDTETRKTFVKVVSQDLRECLKQITASTLLVWGENDTATPLWMGQVMAKEIADAGLVIFENDDHFAYLREWPRFVTVVKAFLK